LRSQSNTTRTKIDPQAQPSAAPKKRSALIEAVNRIEAAAAAGQPFSDTAIAVAYIATNHLNDLGQYRKGRDFIRERIRRFSQKAVTAGFDELAADGPFKMFEAQRQPKGTNVYTFVWHPLTFIAARDAGRAAVAKPRADSYRLKKLEAQRSRVDFGGPLSMEDYEARLDEAHLEARTLANGKVMPARAFAR
jgi:hypothetical protein